MSAGVASTFESGSRSNSASSRTMATISPASAGAAGRTPSTAMDRGLFRRSALGVVGMPAQDRPAGRGRLVEAPARRQARRLVEGGGLARLRAARQIAQRADELVQAVLAFRLGRFHQQGAVDDEGEIHGHGMEALVDHGLGEVEGGDAGILEEAVV